MIDVIFTSIIIIAMLMIVSDCQSDCNDSITHSNSDSISKINIIIYWEACIYCLYFYKTGLIN